jgi:YidC/Oxa1 family membrane protein insertase
MSTNVRMIIAMAVSVVIVILWSMFFLPQNETPTVAEQGDPVVQEKESDVVEEQEPGVENEPEEGSEDSMEATDELPATIVAAEEVKDITVETPLYKVVLSNQAGGSVKSWILKDYEKSFSEEQLDLLGPEEVRGTEFKPFSTVIRDGEGNYKQMPGMPQVSGDLDGDRLVFSGGIATLRFSYFDPEFGKIEKELIFNEKGYDVKVSFDNELSRKYRDSEVLMLMGGGVGDLVQVKEDGLVEVGREANGYLLRKAGGGIEKAPSLITKLDEAKYKEREAALKGNYFSETSNQSRDFYTWAGLENNYFMTLAYGDKGYGFFPVYRLQAVNAVQSGEKTEYFAVPYLGIKTEKDKATFKLYCGPKDLQILENVGQGELKEVISFGMFSFISRPALWLMQQINNYIHNYGFTIIILTIFINLLTLPLIIKQRKSMGQMQLIQPQIKALQQKYKVDKADDIKKRQAKKQKLNEEMMALYKAEGVNPMGGCMPLLIQMPILFALLDMFRVAIELRKAPFILWWNNLSAMDPTYILPIVMAGAMFLSMKLTPSSPDQQNSAMKFMPFLFAFMLASMPSGLVLYWTTSNLFSLGTQVVMNQVSPVKKAGDVAKEKKSAKSDKK